MRAATCLQHTIQAATIELFEQQEESAAKDTDEDLIRLPVCTECGSLRTLTFSQ